MGLFDNFLKDIASSELDKKLEKLADTVEKFSDKIDASADKAVQSSEQAAKKVEAVSETAIKRIDGAKKSLPET